MPEKTVLEEISFGQWLRKRRRALDLTQQAFADQVGCARITLSRIEADTLRPSKELALLLLEKAGISSSEREQWVPFARGQSGLPWKDVQLPSSGPRQTNLPAPLTSFIGRNNEQIEIVKLLDRYRLVTLVGSGGIGKTRLSIKVGEQVAENYADGVWLLELASLSDPMLVPQNAAVLFGLVTETKISFIELLMNFLGSKSVLLIVDNCEHLLDACAHFAEILLKNCPSLKIFTTSREPLGVAGEAIYRVPPLQLPDLQQVLNTFRDFESMRLFEERAKLAQFDFLLTLENASFVAQICQRLDGIPLAIELAAAKTGMFSTEQIAKQLDESFNLLAGDSRTALPRQKTLRASIDWSWDLLSPAEQILIRRLSVFAGGFTLEAAQAVCGGNVLILLPSLVNKSLVMLFQAREPDARYDFHETIRQYANEKLAEAGESDFLRNRHLEHFLYLIEKAETHLRKTEQVEWLRRLDSEHENMRAALTWAMGKPETEVALRLVGALSLYWEIRAYWVEGATWLDHVLAQKQPASSISAKDARAKALYRRAALAYELDDFNVLRTSAEYSLALSLEVKDLWGVAYSRTMIGEFLEQMGNYQGSRALFQQSLLEFQSLGDAWGEAFVRHHLGRVLSIIGTQEEYFENRQRELDSARASGDRYSIAVALLEGFVFNLTFEEKWDEVEVLLQEVEELFIELGSAGGTNWNWTRAYRAYGSFVRGNFEAAKVGANSCIEYCKRIGERASRAMFFIFLGLIAEIENNFQSAIEYQEESLKLLREARAPRQIAWSLAILGRIKYQTNNRDVGLQYIRESLSIVKKGEVSKAKIAYIFCHLGGLFVAKKPGIASQLLGFNELLSQKLPHPRDPIYDKPYFERFLAAAQVKLSEADFADSWDTGKNMTLENAIELVLKTVEEM